MKFYDCLTAPSPRRVRIFIAEKGIEVPTVQVDLGGGEHMGDAFGGINPHRTVPVLRLDDGTSLVDSNSICLFLEETFPEPNLLGRGAKERAVVSMWQRDMEVNGLEAVAECFRNSSKGLRDRALVGPANYPQIAELAERGRQRVRAFFAGLEHRTAQSEFIAGDRFTMADITALVAVDFSRAIKERIPEDALNLRRWHAAVSSRPGV